MGIELRLPNISGTDKEQLVQIRSYLYQIVPQLQWALNNVSATEVSSGTIDQIAKRISSASVSGSGGSSVSAEVTFDKLKPLIIKDADIVEAYYDEIITTLNGTYFAESDFGTFIETTKQIKTETSQYTDQKFENVQVIISEEIEGINVTFNDTLNSSIDNVLNETDSKIANEVEAINSAIDAKIGEVNASIADTNGDIANVNDRIDETNKAITDTNSRIDDTNDKITEVEKAIDDTNTRIDSVNAAILATNVEISGVNSKLDETNDIIDGLTEAIEDTNTNIDILIEAKDLNVEDVEKLNGAISKINGSIDEINTTVEGIETDVTTIDGRVNEVDGQVTQINDSVSLVEKKAVELDESVAKAEQSIIDTNAKVEETSGNVANLQSDVNDTSEKVATLDSLIKEAQEKLNSVNAMVLASRAHIKTGEIDRRVDSAGNEFPVIGIEIGQIDTANGDVVLARYARFTSGALSFYDQNGIEVAYISNNKLFIKKAETLLENRLGGFVDEVAQATRGAITKRDVVTKWEGGEG